MARKLICSLLLGIFLAQAWAQASMALPAEPATRADCAGYMTSDTGCDCCPDGASGSGACATLCAAAIALNAVAPALAIGVGSPPANFHLPARVGPRYLPLNPPPIS